jgi:hypothetical protein
MPRKRNWSGCRCPAGSRRISTRGRGRGWACQSNRPKRVRVKKGPRRGQMTTVKKPFVKAVCGR